MKNLKTEAPDDDDDFLEDLVVDTKLTTYSNLKPGGSSQRLRITMEGWKKDRRKLQRQNNKTMMMMMMTMTRKLKGNSWRGKQENYKAN